MVTPYQTAERIAQDAGVSLNPEDTTKLERSTDVVGDGAGLQLKIDRATPMVLDLYGKRADIRTQAETVGDMLKEKGIITNYKFAHPKDLQDGIVEIGPDDVLANVPYDIFMRFEAV